MNLRTESDKVGPQRPIHWSFAEKTSVMQSLCTRKFCIKFVHFSPMVGCVCVCVCAVGGGQKRSPLSSKNLAVLLWGHSIPQGYRLVTKFARSHVTHHLVIRCGQ